MLCYIHVMTQIYSDINTLQLVGMLCNTILQQAHPHNVVQERQTLKESKTLTILYDYAPCCSDDYMHR